MTFRLMMKNIAGLTRNDSGCIDATRIETDTLEARTLDAEISSSACLVNLE
jgi:hypothetical protein